MSLNQLLFRTRFLELTKFSTHASHMDAHSICDLTVVQMYF